MFGRGPSLFTIIYVAIGIFVAADKNYFKNVEDLGDILSVVLGVLLWPLLLFGVDLRVDGK